MQCALPQVSVIDERRIAITGLPADPAQDLQAASINRVVHQIKDLYADGDRFGEKGREYRRQHQLPMENIGLRLSFTHTTTRRPDGTVIVGLWYNSASRAVYVDSKSHPIRELTADEIEYTMREILNLCAHELHTHLSDIRRSAALAGDEPNYYCGIVPAFCGSLLTVPCC